MIFFTSLSSPYLFPLKIINTSVHGSKLMGTLPYMAPEVINAGEVSVQSEIYSFGVVMLELLTGIAAFHQNRFLATKIEDEIKIRQESLNYENKTLQVSIVSKRVII